MSNDWHYSLLIILHHNIPAPVLKLVAIIAGSTTADGFTALYWLLYAIMFTGIIWSEEIFNTKKVHISSVAICFGNVHFLFLCLFISDLFSLNTYPLCSNGFSANASIAFSPAGVAAHPKPNIFAIILLMEFPKTIKRGGKTKQAMLWKKFS